MSLHLHSREDIEDGPMIGYTLYELIDRTASLGFRVLASTGHTRNICRPEHIRYAAKRGILLIPGVEVGIDGHRHMLILNGGEAAAAVATSQQLKDFKALHPEAFILAPHPNHGLGMSITLDGLRRLKDVVDAVEHNWFYSGSFNPNRQVRSLSAELKLPLIAAADAHFLDFLNDDYAVADIAELTPEAVFQAIRSGRFDNFTRPKSLWELGRITCLMAVWNIALLFKGQPGS